MSLMTINEQDIKLGPTGDGFNLDYNLSAEVLTQIEHQMVEDARSVASDGIVIAWVDPTHSYSNFLRTKEAQHFPEVKETDIYYELNQVYMAIIDTRGEGSVAHATTINFYDGSIDTGDDQDKQRTGFYTIDSLIEHGNFTREEFVAHYVNKGIDPNTTISIETNFKINPDMPNYHDLGSADLAYLGILQWLLRQKWDQETITLFATINEKQIKSLERVGIGTALLMDRSDFRTEEEELGKFSMPVTIDFKNGRDVLSLIGFKLPEITYKAVASD